MPVTDAKHVVYIILESLRLFTGASFSGLSWQVEATANNQKTYFETVTLAEMCSKQLQTYIQNPIHLGKQI